jgi:uncharacterized membrane protein YbaN (DUF454 family)
MKPVYKPLSLAQRAVLIGVGTTTLGFGIAGMFLPGVPTTIFLLITVGCYARSSERLYVWLLTRPWLQKPLQTVFRFKERGTLPLRIKLIAQGVAWSSFILTVFTGASLFAQISTLALATTCSIVMAVIKTDDDPLPARTWRLAPADIAEQLWFGALAGALGGAIWGLGGRVIMRFVANVAGQAPQFDLRLTLMMLVATTVLGLLTGLAYAGLRRWLPKGKWIHGITFGLLVMLTLGTILYVNPYLQADITRVGLQWRELIVALFIPNFIIYGLVTSLAFGRLARDKSAQAAARHRAAPSQPAQ